MKVNEDTELASGSSLRILGPTVRDTFCIATDDGLVWTRDGWRQFGRPWEFGDFRQAWIQTESAREALTSLT